MNWSPLAKFFVAALIVYGLAQLVPELVNWILALILLGMLVVDPAEYNKMLAFAASIVSGK